MYTKRFIISEPWYRDEKILFRVTAKASFRLHFKLTHGSSQSIVVPTLVISQSLREKMFEKIVQENPPAKFTVAGSGLLQTKHGLKCKNCEGDAIHSSTSCVADNNSVI